MLTFFMGSMNVFAGVFITFVGNRFGKRTNLVMGIFGQVVAWFMFLYGLTFEKALLVILGSYLYVFLFGISLGGTLYAYLADAVPSVGLSYTALMQWLIGCVIAGFGLSLVESLG